MKRYISMSLSAVFVLLSFVVPGASASMEVHGDYKGNTSEYDFSSPISVDQEGLRELTNEELAEIYNEDNYKNDFMPGEVLVGMKTTVAESQGVKAAFPELNVTEIEDSYETIMAALPKKDEAIFDSCESKMTVLYREEITESALQALKSLRAVYTLKLVSETKESVLEAIEILRKDPNVAYAEPNYISYPAITPDDYTNYNLWGMEKIHAPEAWDIATGSHSVRVGVLDSGFDYTHPDLAANIDQSLAYYVAEGTYGYAADISDTIGHGTHVAGIIGAVGNNIDGVVGVNWNVTIIPIKITISNTNSSTNATLRKAAVLYATALELPVINMSYELSYSQSFNEAVSAYKGLFVIAAGNGIDHDNDPSTPKIPVNNDNDIAYSSLHVLGNVIFVANSISTDSLYTTSNYGSNTVDLAAPGSTIYSTIPGGSYGNKNTRMHDWLSTGNGVIFTGNNGWWNVNGYDATKITGKVVCGNFYNRNKCDIAAFYNYGNDVTRLQRWKSVWW